VALIASLYPLELSLLDLRVEVRPETEVDHVVEGAPELPWNEQLRGQHGSWLDKPCNPKHFVVASTNTEHDFIFGGCSIDNSHGNQVHKGRDGCDQEQVSKEFAKLGFTRVMSDEHPLDESVESVRQGSGDEESVKGEFDGFDVDFECGEQPSVEPCIRGYRERDFCQMVGEDFLEEAEHASGVGPSEERPGDERSSVSGDQTISEQDGIL